MIQTAMILIASLLGSIPTALLLSHWKTGGDIRRQGDGNMGAQNTAHVLGQKYGILVALIDASKAALAVLLARGLGLTLGWQMIAGVAAILGHDFTVFAHFKGGQGTACTLGVYLVLFTLPAMVGMVVYGMLYALTHKHDIAAGVAGGLIFVQVLFMRLPWYMLVYVLMLFIFIPVKKAADAYRRKEITSHGDWHQDAMLKEKAQDVKHRAQ
jgi:glycerol-3-phosphate acyltransferase PlsY